MFLKPTKQKNQRIWPTRSWRRSFMVSVARKQYVHSIFFKFPNCILFLFSSFRPSIYSVLVSSLLSSLFLYIPVIVFRFSTPSSCLPSFLPQFHSWSLLKTMLIFLDKREIPPIDMGFVISATAVEADDNFKQMKNIIDRMILKYGSKTIRYSMIVFGDRPDIKIR